MEAKKNVSTPSEAHHHVLERDISIVAAKPVIDVACPLLRELVNYGTGALIRCNLMPQRALNGRFAGLALYHHVIEMTDAIEVLISQCCARPAIPTLRSSFEGFLSLAYILEDKEKYAQRSDSWLVGSVREWLAFYKLMNPESGRGKEFFEATKNRPHAVAPPGTAGEIRPGEGNFQKLLAQPEYQKIQEEFAKQSKNRPNWYSLFDGPQNLRELAKHLRMLPEYEVLYTRWSRTTHAQEHMNFFGEVRGGESVMARLREGKELPLVASLAVTLILGATTRTLRFVRPDEDIKAWQREQVKPRQDALQKIVGDAARVRRVGPPA